MTQKYLKSTLQISAALLLLVGFVVMSNEGHAIERTMMMAMHWVHP
jgi:hypothetical protein